MQIGEWVEQMRRSGHICGDYCRRLEYVTNRKELFRVLCDANGGRWLFDLDAKKVVLPVEDFVKEYASAINGQQVVDYDGYTSTFYVRYNGDIQVSTTLVYCLECKTKIFVPANKWPTVILSSVSTADIALSPSARINIELYGNAKYTVSGDMSRVRINRH